MKNKLFITPGTTAKRHQAMIQHAHAHTISMKIVTIDLNIIMILMELDIGVESVCLV